jgi:hypothetical protein
VSSAKIRVIPEKTSSATLLGGPMRRLTGLQGVVDLSFCRGIASRITFFVHGSNLSMAPSSGVFGQRI